MYSNEIAVYLNYEFYHCVTYINCTSVLNTYALLVYALLHICYKVAHCTIQHIGKHFKIILSF